LNPGDTNLYALSYITGKKFQSTINDGKALFTIMDIQPVMKNPWTVLVQVVEPRHIQTSNAGNEKP